MKSRHTERHRNARSGIGMPDCVLEFEGASNLSLLR